MKKLGELAGSLAFIQLLDEQPTVAVRKRFLNQPHSSDAMLLMFALDRCGLMSDRIKPLLISLEELNNTNFAPPPLITGDDLTAAGGLPGPKFKQALDAAYDAQLEDRIATKQEAMKLAIQILS